MLTHLKYNTKKGTTMIQNKQILTTDEALAIYCPNAKTLREICGDDTAKLQDYCQQLGCTPDEVIINKQDMMTLVNFAPISASKKLEFRQMLSGM